MLVFADLDQQNPRFSVAQIEAAMLTLPLELFGVADRAGVSRDNGLKAARAKLMDDLRRRLMSAAESGHKQPG